jgi:DNA-cytosine methyltransferase
MKNMNVLSLFDGISCGQVALNRIGLKYANYFSSEIHIPSIKVTQYHYPNTIQLGSVLDWKLWNLPKIDLLIGGSPCQGFSFAGKQLNFEDSRSKLFFEFVDILNEIKPKYFLLENVKMKKECQDIITKYLGVEPIMINSANFSKQNRNRLYWTNIPILQIPKCFDNFDGYLYRRGHGYIRDEIKYFKKYPTLLAQSSPVTTYRIVIDYDRAYFELINNNLEKIRKGNLLTRSSTPEECEEFQTLPKNYTSILNKSQRYKVIGNGWTVDVIAHIFKSLLNKY